MTSTKLGGSNIPSVNSKLIIIMVGLPARGKSYIVKKLERYLNWMQLNTKIFNVGERRRKADATDQQLFRDKLSTSSFFNPHDASLVSLREKLALQTLDELLDWLTYSSGSIGILDATNSTVARRQTLLSHISIRFGKMIDILFLESCCFDGDVIDRNIKLKLVGPDYAGKDPEKSLADFKERISHYEKTYTPLGQAEETQKCPYVQMIDVGRKVNTHLIKGYLQTQVVEYLLNFNLAKRQIWVTCNGQSIDDSNGRIGRDSNLSKQGKQFAAALVNFMEQQVGSEQTDGREMAIWTSMMSQTIQTANAFPNKKYKKSQLRVFNDINAGTMTGLTFAEIEYQYPTEYELRKRDNLLYRWPGLRGEGYIDLIARLRPVIVELEGIVEHVLLITHRAVVRVLLAYFMNIRKKGLPDIVLPEGAVFCFESEPYGVKMRCFQHMPAEANFRELSESEVAPFIK